MLKTFCFVFLFTFCTFAEDLGALNLEPVSAPVVTVGPKLSVLQTQISNCGLTFPNLNKISNYNQLYAALDKKYLLFAEKIVEREIRYRSKGENYKLRVNNDIMSLFRLGEEDRVIPTTIDIPKPIDAKQKITTVKGKIKQLTLNAKIEEDWGQYFEQRENGVQIEYSIRNSKISQMKIDLTKTKQTLDCKVKSDSEVCFCLK